MLRRPVGRWWGSDLIGQGVDGREKRMSVIVELSIAPDEFELGRILVLSGATNLTLETMVPLGERSIPFFRLYDDGFDSFEASVREHPAVDQLELVNRHGDESLYALDWLTADDAFLTTIREADAHLLEATGAPDRWQFELRFPSHEHVSGFAADCADADIDFEIDRIFNPTRPDAGPWYGLSEPQRETLVAAVERGYYAIPREVSTKELAEELGVSDQAVTERLRRAIGTLTRNALLSLEDEQ